MPKDPDSNLVLITGINSYIGSHIGLLFLEKGYSVRGTSRKLFARDRLLEGPFAGYESQYTHCVVADITVEGAFDEAVKGVNVIVHVASPVHFDGTTVDEYFKPAVGGVLSLLNSTRLAGAQLNKIVLTSSVSAIADRWKTPSTYTYSEDDWNTSGEGVARANFTAPVAYGASKAIAEKAFWDWHKEHSPSFAMSAIQPGVCMGPPILWPEHPDQLNSTLKPVWALYSGKLSTVPPQIGDGPFVDVRDVAGFHVWCAEHAESDGQRYLMTNGKAPPQAVADLLRSKYPDKSIVVGKPGTGYRPDYWFLDDERKLPAFKAYRALGIERFRPFQDMIIDTVEAFERRWPQH